MVSEGKFTQFYAEYRLQSAFYARDAFCLFYDAKTKTVKALNGSGRAPAKLDIDYALSRGLKKSIPLTDLNSVTVPGKYSPTYTRTRVPNKHTQGLLLHG